MWRDVAMMNINWKFHREKKEKHTYTGEKKQSF
jgi:hypothetical protein